VPRPAGRPGAQAQQRGTGIDLGVHTHRDRDHDAGHRRADGGLHLHRFEHRDRVAGGQLHARLNVHGDDQRRPAGAHDHAVLALDPMGAAVGLDAPARAAGDHQQAVPAPAAGDAALTGAQRIDADVGAGAAVAHRVLARTDVVDIQAVTHAAVGQHDARAHRGRLFRPPARRRGEECLLGQQVVGFVGFDGRGEQHHRLQRGAGAPGEHVVEPAVVDRAFGQVGTFQQFQQQAAVAGAAFDRHRGPFQGPAQPPQRQAPIGSAGGDHGEQRIAGIHPVADAAAGVDAHAGADRERQQSDPTGHGVVIAGLGVLGQQPGLEGHGRGGRLARRQGGTLVDAQAPADDADAGALLGAGMHRWGCGVEAGDDEPPACVREADHPCAAVAGLARDADRGAGHARRQFGVDARGRQFAQQRCAVAAQADVADAEHPYRAVVVGDDVDLGMTGRCAGGSSPPCPCSVARRRASPSRRTVAASGPTTAMPASPHAAIRSARAPGTHGPSHSVSTCARRRASAMPASVSRPAPLGSRCTTSASRPYQGSTSASRWNSTVVMAGASRAWFRSPTALSTRTAVSPWSRTPRRWMVVTGEPPGQPPNTARRSAATAAAIGVGSGIER
jgi:hypothetical protein